jgi:hypothetical protein
MPSPYALDLYRGDTFARTFRLWEDAAMTSPVDLTGATARAEIRDELGGTLLVELVCTVTAPNIVDVALPAAAWPAGSAWTVGVWDLELTTGAVVTTIVAGPVRVSGDVTTP